MVLVLLMVSLQPVLAQDDPKPGGFGFSIEVDADGIFNPTLNTITVKSVVPGRPAALAGIAAGDQILEVDGKVIAGSKAREMEKLMKRNVGEKVRLKIRKPDGEVVAVIMMAAARPN